MTVRKEVEKGWRANARGEKLVSLFPVCQGPLSGISKALGPRTSHVAWVVKKLPATEGDLRDAGLIPGLGRSPGEGHGNLLQYSCLENPTDRGPWQAIVHAVAKSWTWLKQLSLHLSPDLRKMQTHRKVYKLFQGVQEFPKILVLQDKNSYSINTTKTPKIWVDEERPELIRGNQVRGVHCPLGQNRKKQGQMKI